MYLVVFCKGRSYCDGHVWSSRSAHSRQDEGYMRKRCQQKGKFHDPFLSMMFLKQFTLQNVINMSSDILMAWEEFPEICAFVVLQSFPKDWTIQSPWPDSEVVVDGEVIKVASSFGTFNVYLTGGKVHQIRRKTRDAIHSRSKKSDFQSEKTPLVIQESKGPPHRPPNDTFPHSLITVRDNYQPPLSLKPNGLVRALFPGGCHRGGWYWYP